MGFLKQEPLVKLGQGGLWIDGHFVSVDEGEDALSVVRGINEDGPSHIEADLVQVEVGAKPTGVRITVRYAVTVELPWKG